MTITTFTYKPCTHDVHFKVIYFRTWFWTFKKEVNFCMKCERFVNRK